MVACCLLLYFIEDIHLSRAHRLNYSVLMFCDCAACHVNCQLGCLSEDWRAVEFFAGKANLTMSLKKLSFKTIALDYEYAPDQKYYDLLTPAGMALPDSN